ncbi:hypothetical protein AAVH_10948 [Aphelenchoides avenae]|nr:hypothetical protein AAVH_22267 [Aphelenchus avenae]KAH7721487.1 hypothetical protein AAVH_10948 [Aphelenchus avenae]
MNACGTATITFVVLGLAHSYQVDDTCGKRFVDPNWAIGLRFKASPRCKGESPKTPYYATFFDITGEFPVTRMLRDWEAIRLCAETGDIDLITCGLAWEGDGSYINANLSMAIVHFCGDEPTKSKLKYVKFPTTIMGGKWATMDLVIKRNISTIDMGVINLDQ